MSDERLRSLERTWRGTGAQADLEALLRARLRAGALTRERLQLAAFVGDPAARAVYDPPSEAELDAALAPTFFDGVEAEVAAAWEELRRRLTRSPEARLIVEAARTSPLVALLPHASSFSRATVSFRRCTGEDRDALVTIARSGEGHAVVDRAGGTELGTLVDAVALASRHVPATRPVWRGHRHGLLLERLRRGAADELASAGLLLVGLAAWPGPALARAVHALLAGADAPRHAATDAVASALRAWLLDPGPDTLAAVALARKAVGPALQHPTWPVAVAAHLSLDGDRLAIGNVDRLVLPDDAALRACIRDALAPWALGLDDPLAV
jgi:hypothetical protein